MKDELKDRIWRQMVVYDFPLSQEEFEIIEFTLLLYINSEAHPQLYERFLEKITTKLKEIEYDKKLMKMKKDVTEKGSL